MGKAKIAFLLLFLNSLLSAQTVYISAGNVTCMAGDSVVVPLDVSGFTGIGAVTISLYFDPNVLEWGRMLNWHDQMKGAYSGMADGNLVLAFSSIGGINISGGRLAELKFRYKGGSSPLSFIPGKSEIADLNGNPFIAEYTNGMVSPAVSQAEDKTHSGTLHKFELYQNYPNPFNSVTKIRYSLPAACRVTITVYNSIGKNLGILTDTENAPGIHDIFWDAENFSSGIYYLLIKAREPEGQQAYSAVKKMLLLK